MFGFCGTSVTSTSRPGSNGVKASNATLAAMHKIALELVNHASNAAAEEAGVLRVNFGPSDFLDNVPFFAFPAVVAFSAAKSIFFDSQSSGIEAFFLLCACSSFFLLRLPCRLPRIGSSSESSSGSSFLLPLLLCPPFSLAYFSSIKYLYFPLALAPAS